MAKGVHPRHPPRAFPLGLLAPRCLGAVLLLASAPCSALARAPLRLGRGSVPLPSVGLLLALVIISSPHGALRAPAHFGLSDREVSFCEPSRDRTFWFVAPQGFPGLFSTLETTLLESLVC